MLCIWLLETLGRKVSLMSTLLTGGFLCVLILAVPQGNDVAVTTLAISGRFFINWSGSICNVYVQELFPTSFRGTVPPGVPAGYLFYSVSPSGALSRHLGCRSHHPPPTARSPEEEAISWSSGGDSLGACDGPCGPAPGHLLPSRWAAAAISRSRSPTSSSGPETTPGPDSASTGPETPGPDSASTGPETLSPDPDSASTGPETLGPDPSSPGLETHDSDASDPSCPTQVPSLPSRGPLPPSRWRFEGRLGSGP
uniref:leucine-rich repeat extensin-like protein 5 n=1 Tax=Gasterosteus aculeatus aculeatus TaxID=481459 RepID=UPI001A9A29BF|nr:leucine-rich repeat extensin-like protein 5 [Gasterosteus aculeatus aculeatus]XP_040026361.1 leucine-rich repeat extensin-like protein 5 [Gasterosteus aculeatus aculeatus]